MLFDTNKVCVVILNWELNQKVSSVRKRESLPPGMRHQFIGITMPSKYSKFRTSAAKKQQYRCYYCNAPMWTKNLKKYARKHKVSLDQAELFQCTAEHLVARCDGGEDSRTNIVAACKFCNHGRHRRQDAQSPIEHMAFVKERVFMGVWHLKILNIN